MKKYKEILLCLIVFIIIFANFFFMIFIIHSNKKENTFNSVSTKQNIVLRGNPSNATSNYPAAYEDDSGSYGVWPEILNGDLLVPTWGNRVRSSIISIQKELGLNPSGSYNTVLDRLTGIEGKLPNPNLSYAGNLVLNPLSASTDAALLQASVNSALKFKADAEGDVTMAGNYYSGNWGYQNVGVYFGSSSLGDSTNKSYIRQNSSILDMFGYNGMWLRDPASNLAIVISTSRIDLNSPVFMKSSSNPDLSSGGYANGTMTFYQKGSKLICQYKESGSVKWKYLDMSGTGTTWQYTTSAP